MKQAFFLTTLPEKLERLGILVNIITVVLIVFTIYGIKVPIIINGKFIIVNAQKGSDAVVKFYSSEIVDITKSDKNVLLSGLYGKNHKMAATVINDSICNNELILDLKLMNSAGLSGPTDTDFDRHGKLLVGKKSLLFTLFRLTE
ncbi:hypothetical protein [Olivibacter jilunii]|uniref:hypothetical protein n=1 Tax=Olivibacter jilunii TaxID=985016 RepID=UPI003F13DE99